MVPHHLHLHAGLAPGARVPEVPDARVLAELLRVRVAEVALEVGVRDGVSADLTLAPRVLELLPHQRLQLRHRGVGAERLVLLPAKREMMEL